MQSIRLSCTCSAERLVAERGVSMANLANLLEGLDGRHQSALRWFFDNMGAERQWPDPIGDETLLASHAKGIYKPEWMEFALSVRESLESPYADFPPDGEPDGSWSWMYFQEGADPDARDEEYTNRALMACLEHSIPVGAFRQISPKPRPVAPPRPGCHSRSSRRSQWPTQLRLLIRPKI